MNIGLICVVSLGLLAYKYLSNRNMVNFFVVLQFLIFRCYNLGITGHGTPIRPDDMALLLIILFLVKKKSAGMLHLNAIGNVVKCFILFLIISMFVSIFFKDLPILQVIKETRNFVFVLSIFIVCNLNKGQIDEILYKVFMLHCIFCVLFIIQTFIPSLGVLSDMESERISMTGYLGFRRFYGYPPLMAFGCLYAFLLFPNNKSNKKLYIALNFLALLLVQSRGMMLNIVLLIVLASVLFKASTTKKIIYVSTAIILIVFVNMFIFSGDTGSRTSNDINTIMSSNIMDIEKPDGEATLTFRIWVLANRLRAINEGGILDGIFGLGLFVELPLNEIMKRGLISVAAPTYEGNYGIYTPDISYANHLAFLGYVGSALFWSIFILMIAKSYKLRRNCRYAQICLLYLIYMIASGFNNMEISSSSCLIMPFILMMGAVAENNELIKNKYGRYSYSKL